MTIQSAIPAYHQVYVLLAERIHTGHYRPMDLLPSELQLAEDYGVSRVTIRRALQLLAEDGYIVKRHGKGAFVNKTIRHESETRTVRGPLGALVAKGISTNAKTLFWGTAPAPIEVAERLTGSRDGTCLLIQRVRQIADQPYSYTSIYLPPELGELLEEKKAEERLVIEMIDETSYVPVRAEHTLTATLADKPITDYLGVAAGAPLLKMHGFVYGQEGELIYYQKSLYHPEHYEYHAELHRDASTRQPSWEPGPGTQKHD